eukprot:scaffold2383_cov161-Amphora_coffeaeformis.AAC.24
MKKFVDEYLSSSTINSEIGLSVELWGVDLPKNLACNTQNSNDDSVRVRSHIFRHGEKAMSSHYNAALFKFRWDGYVQVLHPVDILPWI